MFNRNNAGNVIIYLGINLKKTPNLSVFFSFPSDWLNSAGVVYVKLSPRDCGEMLQKEFSRIFLFYLLKKLPPDFRTIADFRKDNTKALKNVFRAFVKLCMKLDLYHKELLAIDGSKFSVFFLP